MQLGWRPLQLGWRPLQLGWRSEAIAARLEAIAARLEAIAAMLEATAARMEAIAGVGPSTCQTVHLCKQMTWEGAFNPEPWIHTVGEGSSISLAGRAWIFDSKLMAYSCTTWLTGQKFCLIGAHLDFL